MWHITTCRQAIHDKIRKAMRSNCEKRLLDSSYLSVRLSVRMKQPVSHWPDFYEIWFLSISRKPSDKYIFHENFIRITGTLHEDQYSFMTISRSLLLRTINVSDKRCRGGKKTHFMFKNLFSKIVPLWDNVEKYCRAGQDTDDNMANFMFMVPCILVILVI